MILSCYQSVTARQQDCIADRFGVGRYHHRSAIGLDRASPDMHDHGLAGDLDEWLAGQSGGF